MKETTKGHRTKQKVIDCALELFATHGYAGTSMNDIIEKLGISKGSVYWHFKNKEDIFVEVVTDSYSRWLTIVDRELADIDDPIEKIRKYSELFINVVEIPVWRITPETYWIEFEPQNRLILDTLFAKDDIILQEIFEDAINRGLLRFKDPIDAEKLTWIFISSLEGMFEKIVLSYKSAAASIDASPKRTKSTEKLLKEFEKHKQYALDATEKFIELITK